MCNQRVKAEFRSAPLNYPLDMVITAPRSGGGPIICGRQGELGSQRILDSRELG